MAKGGETEEVRERKGGKTHHELTCLFPIHKGARDGIGSEDLIPKKEHKGKGT